MTRDTTTATGLTETAQMRRRIPLIRVGSSTHGGNSHRVSAAASMLLYRTVIRRRMTVRQWVSLGLRRDCRPTSSRVCGRY